MCCGECVLEGGEGEVKMEGEGEGRWIEYRIENEEVYIATMISLNNRFCPWITLCPQSHLDALLSCPCLVR